MFHRFIPRTDFNRYILTLIGGTALAQAIPLLFSPLLTRLYLPSDFGVLALYVSLVTIFSSVASGRYEYAIMIPKEEDDAINIFAFSFVILVSVTILLSLVVVIFHSYIVEIFGMLELAFWIYFLPVSVFFTTFFILLTNYNNRHKHYKDIAISGVYKSSVLVFVQVIAGVTKGGTFGLLMGQFISSFVGNRKLLKNIFKTQDFIKRINISKIKAIAKEHKNFPKYQLPNTILSTISLNMPIFIFSSFFSATVVGLYTFASKILFLPLMIISGSSAKVYNQTLVEIYNQKGDSFGFTINFLKSLIKKIILPFIVVVWFAPEIFSFIFGERWIEAGYYTQVLSPYIFLSTVVSSVAFIASLLQNQKISLYISIVHFILCLGALAIGAFFNDIYLALILYACVSSIVLVYNLLWMLFSLKAEK